MTTGAVNAATERASKMLNRFIECHLLESRARTRLSNDSAIGSARRELQLYKTRRRCGAGAAVGPARFHRSGMGAPGSRGALAIPNCVMFG
jgi:hypothetical protein